jgi:hypothetical protein
MIQSALRKWSPVSFDGTEIFQAFNDKNIDLCLRPAISNFCCGSIGLA